VILEWRDILQATGPSESAVDRAEKGDVKIDVGPVGGEFSGRTSVTRKKERGTLAPHSAHIGEFTLTKLDTLMCPLMVPAVLTLIKSATTCCGQTHFVRIYEGIVVLFSLCSPRSRRFR
jgi:hypothetical protein